MTTLADILDDPNYTNANAATKQAIFDKYSADEPNYTNANAATQAAIRQRYGLSAPQAAAESGAKVDLTPQALTVGRELAGLVPQGVSTGVDLVKQGATNLAKVIGNRPLYQTAADIAGIATHGLPWGSIARQALDPNATTMREAIGGISGLAKEGAGMIGSGVRNVGGAVARGLMAPESLMALPYEMAGYEAEKIRANPNAPQYATNPYAQMTRGEYATQGQAGAANRRASIQGFNTAGNPANPQMPAAQPVAQQPPTAGNYLERMIEISKRFRL
jgi:hypothetical protein